MSKWYRLINGQQSGPLAPAALKHLAASGQLKPTDKVRREDMGEWYLAKDLTGLWPQSTDLSKDAPQRTSSQVEPSIAATCLRILALFWWLFLARVLFYHHDYDLGRTMLAWSICFAVARYNPWNFHNRNAYLVLFLGLVPAVVLLFINDSHQIGNFTGLARIGLASIGHAIIVWLFCCALFGRSGVAGESFAWSQRTFEYRGWRLAVFLVGCVVLLPATWYAGRFLSTRLYDVNTSSKPSSMPRDVPAVSVDQVAVRRYATADISSVPESTHVTELEKSRQQIQIDDAPVQIDVVSTTPPKTNDKLTFDTTGHKNAHGLRMKISYPATWKAEEGSGPVTVQTLISNGRHGNQAVLIQAWALPKPLDRELTENEKRAYLDAGQEQGMRNQAFGSKTEVKFQQIGKLNDETCGITELEAIVEQGGVAIGMKALVFVVLRHGVQLMLTCYVQGDASGGVSAIWKEYDATKPLFIEIAESCFFADEPVESTELR